MTIVWDFSNYTTTWGCVAWRGTLESLAAVFPNPLSLTQNQTLHRLFYFLPAYARFEIQLSFERIDPEKITVRLAGRRTRTVVSDPAEVIPAMPLSAGQLVNPGNAIGLTRGGRRQDKQNPMSPGHGRVCTDFCGEQ